MVQQHPNPRDRILLVVIGMAVLVVLLPCLWPALGAAHAARRFGSNSANHFWTMVLELVLAISIPVVVWFYFWQNEIKSRQLSLRSLLWLLLAVSIGLSVGSWIAGPTIRRGLGLP